MIGLHWWPSPPQTCQKMRQKTLVPTRQVGTNPKSLKRSEQPKPAPRLSFRLLFRPFRLFRRFLKGLGSKTTKIATYRHLSNRLGVGLKGNLRRIKHPSKRGAGHAPTCNVQASLTVIAEVAPTFHPPTPRGTPCVAFRTMAGRTAQTGCPTP